MPGSLHDRLAVVRATLRRDAALRRLPVRDAMRGALAWYGRERARLARRARVTPDGRGFVWVDIGPYGLLWPEGSSLERLYTALVELRVSSNPHYYFRTPTRVRTGDRVLDVGACEGAFALECIRTHGAAAVWCFEPGPVMASALRATAERNGLADSMRIVEAAVSSSAGSGLLLEDPGNPLVAHMDGSGERGSAAVAREIRCVALDEWADVEGVERIDYLKIDAEGSDVAVLEGARAVLTRWRPRIAATTYHEPDHCERMIDLLASLDAGYRFDVRGVVAFDGVARPVMLHATAER